MSSSRASGFFNRPIAWALCLMLLIGIGIVRIVATYHVFNHTIDEGAHVACGIEWLEKGQYRYETLHPPLARISVALGPYLAGCESRPAFQKALADQLASFKEADARLAS